MPTEPAAAACPARAADPGVPLALAHEREIEARLAPLRAALGKDCLSDYAFSNLFLFRAAHAYRYLPGPLPCVAGLTYDGARHLLPLFDIGAARPEALAQRLAGHDCFFPVGAEAVARLDARRFAWSHRADDADYLYPAANFRDYRGERLRKKGNLMRQLLAAHAVHSRPLDARRIEDALAVLAGWMAGKGKAPGEADEQACREALGLMERFGLDGVIHYADGIAAGFLLAQPLAGGVSVMRFAKGADAFKGIYQYMFHHYCATRAVDWLNFEQDLGLPNFRRTKRSYQPSALLAKFRVTLKA